MGWVDVDPVLDVVDWDVLLTVDDVKTVVMVDIVEVRDAPNSIKKAETPMTTDTVANNLNESISIL